MLCIKFSSRHWGDSSEQKTFAIMELTFWCVCAKLFQSCQTLCDPMYYNPPGFSDHGILQPRILECIAMLSSKGSSRPDSKMWKHSADSRVIRYYDVISYYDRNPCVSSTSIISWCHEKWHSSSHWPDSLSPSSRISREGGEVESQAYVS